MLNGTFDGIHLTCTADGGTSTVDYILASAFLFQYIVRVIYIYKYIFKVILDAYCIAKKANKRITEI